MLPTTVGGHTNIDVLAERFEAIAKEPLGEFEQMLIRREGRDRHGDYPDGSWGLALALPPPTLRGGGRHRPRASRHGRASACDLHGARRRASTSKAFPRARRRPSS